jgi:hypothetical protein
MTKLPVLELSEFNRTDMDSPLCNLNLFASSESSVTAYVHDIYLGYTNDDRDFVIGNSRVTTFPDDVKPENGCIVTEPFPAPDTVVPLIFTVLESITDMPVNQDTPPPRLLTAAPTIDDVDSAMFPAITV